MAGDISRIYNTKFARGPPISRPFSAGPSGKRPGRSSRTSPELKGQFLEADVAEAEDILDGISTRTSPCNVNGIEQAFAGTAGTTDTGYTSDGGDPFFCEDGQNEVNNVDVSKVNEGRHNSQRMDTFLTPKAKPVYLPGGAFRLEWLQLLRRQLRMEMKDEMLRLSKECTNTMKGLNKHYAKTAAQSRAGMNEDLKTAVSWIREDFMKAVEEIQSSTFKTGGRISAAIMEDLKDELSPLRKELRALQASLSSQTQSEVVSTPALPQPEASTHGAPEVGTTRNIIEVISRDVIEAIRNVQQEVKNEVESLRADLLWQKPAPAPPAVTELRELSDYRTMFEHIKNEMEKLHNGFTACSNDVRVEIRRSKDEQISSKVSEMHEVMPPQTTHGAQELHSMLSSHFMAVEENLKRSMKLTAQGVNQLNETLTDLTAEIRSKESTLTAQGVNQLNETLTNLTAEIRSKESTSGHVHMHHGEGLSVQASNLQEELRHALTDVQRGQRFDANEMEQLKAELQTQLREALNEIHKELQQRNLVDEAVFAPHIDSVTSRLKSEMSSHMSIVHQGINQVTSQIGESLVELRKESHTHQLCQDTNRLLLDIRQEMQKSLKSLSRGEKEPELPDLSDKDLARQEFLKIHEMLKADQTLLIDLTKDFAETRTSIESTLGEVKGTQIAPFKELEAQIGLLRQDLSAPWVPILHEEASLLRRGLSGIQDELKSEMHLLRQDLKEVASDLETANYKEVNKELLSHCRNSADAVSEIRAAVCGIHAAPHINGDLMTVMNQVRQEFAKSVAQIKSASYMAQSIPQLKAEVSLLHQDLVQANKAQTTKAETEMETLHLLKAELMRFHQDRTKAQSEIQMIIRDSISKEFLGGSISETMAEIQESKAFLAQGVNALQKVSERRSEEVLQEIRNTKEQKVKTEHLAERTSLLIDVIKEERNSQSYKAFNVERWSPMAMSATPLIPDVLSPVGSTARKLTAAEVVECKKAQT